MTRHLGRNLGEVPLEEEVYRVDFEVADRYQAFSTEILRLSLLGVAGYGFLLSEVVFKADPTAEARRFFHEHAWLSLGIVAFGLSAAFALVHRYYSTDCVTHLIRRLRIERRLSAARSHVPGGGDATDVDVLRQLAQEETASFERDLAKCRWSLLGAGMLLFAGAMTIAGAFAWIVIVG